MHQLIDELSADKASSPVVAEKNGPRILFIGALPPPHIGPTLANLRLLSSPKIQDLFTLRFLDISDRRAAQTMGRLEFGNIFLGMKHSMQFLKQLCTFAPSVVYLGISQGTWGWLRDLCFIVPSLLTSRSVVLHLRGSEFREFYQSMSFPLHKLTRWALSRSSVVIVLGTGLRRIFDGIVDPSCIRVIPNGIAVDNYDRVPATSFHTSGPPRILFLSSLRKRKGIHLLLESLPHVVSFFPEVRLTIAGGWRTEEDRRRAEELIDRHGLGSLCDFSGEVSGEAKIRLFKDHDLFVFPPVEPEGLPWVILEAMSAGLPVVTTDQGAIREVVEHGRTGLIVDPEPVAIGKAICTMLTSPENARAMGVRGRQRVEEHFSEQAYINAIAAALSDACSVQKPASPS